MSAQDQARFHDEDMLTVADAARIARRSARTIRRAYLSDKLLAHRDGNGRGVRIRYGDLRTWLTAEVVTPTTEVVASQPIGQAGVRRQAEGHMKTGNLELLTAVRQRRARRARASAASASGDRAAFGSR